MEGAVEGPEIKESIIIRIVAPEFNVDVILGVKVIDEVVCTLVIL